MPVRQRFFFSIAFGFCWLQAGAQQAVRWVNVDTAFGPLPPSVQVFRTTDPLDDRPNIAYYLVADLKDKRLQFGADTTLNRRLTPREFYVKNDRPLAVVNCTFFSFETHQNLNVVMEKGRLKGYNTHTIKGRGRDTFTYLHPLGSAIGIDKKRNADIAWVYTDSSLKYAYAIQTPQPGFRDSTEKTSLKHMLFQTSIITHRGTVPTLRKWKMRTAVGGGPVLLQAGALKITNEEERKFYGAAINDRHPRTAMGYTREGKLVILVIQGRHPGLAEGATLLQAARLLQELGCVEALNLDGGGSSCLLVNGRETITPASEKGIQRAVPAVFMIQEK